MARTRVAVVVTAFALTCATASTATGPLLVDTSLEDLAGKLRFSPGDKAARLILEDQGAGLLPALGGVGDAAAKGGVGS